MSGDTAFRYIRTTAALCPPFVSPTCRIDSVGERAVITALRRLHRRSVAHCGNSGDHRLTCQPKSGIDRVESSPPEAECDPADRPFHSRGHSTCPTDDSDYSFCWTENHPADSPQDAALYTFQLPALVDRKRSAQLIPPPRSSASSPWPTSQLPQLHPAQDWARHKATAAVVWRGLCG